MLELSIWSFGMCGAHSNVEEPPSLGEWVGRVLTKKKKVLVGLHSRVGPTSDTNNEIERVGEGEIRRERERDSLNWRIGESGKVGNHWRACHMEDDASSFLVATYGVISFCHVLQVSPPPPLLLFPNRRHRHPMWVNELMGGAWSTTGVGVGGAGSRGWCWRPSPRLELGIFHHAKKKKKPIGKAEISTLSRKPTRFQMQSPSTLLFFSSTHTKFWLFEKKNPVRRSFALGSNTVEPAKVRSIRRLDVQYYIVNGPNQPSVTINSLLIWPSPATIRNLNF